MDELLAILETASVAGTFCGLVVTRAASKIMLMQDLAVRVDDPLVLARAVRAADDMLSAHRWRRIEPWHWGAGGAAYAMVEPL